MWGRVAMGILYLNDVDRGIMDMVNCNKIRF
jgi:hypothetical protein